MFTKKTRLKMRLAKLGKNRPQVVKEKIRLATILAMKNPLIKEKMRLAKLGKIGNKKGYKCTIEQIERIRESHKGQIAWNKGRTDLPKQTKEQIKKRVDKMMGNMNPAWKGDGIGYGGVHYWIRNTYGKAKKCVNKICPKKSLIYEWANISGLYKRDRKDYLELCRSCHRKFDKGTLPLAVIKG